MTATYNVHMGLVSWAASTSYTKGQRILSSANCYQCIGNGTSATVGGPVGVANNIVDSTVVWKYVSPVDYSGATGDVVFTAAQNGLPATFTQNVIWYVWNSNNGLPIQTSAVGTWFLYLQGHTVPPHSLTIMPAPGEGFRDSLFLKKTIPYTANAAYGVTFQTPSTGQGLINYFEIHDDNVIIDGFQFVDPLIYSQSTLMALSSNNSIAQNCIFDGNGQNNGACMIAVNAPSTTATYKNCLIIDRQPSGYYTSEPGTTMILNGAANYLTNCGVISYNNAGSTGEGIRSDTIAWANNCYMFGFAWSNFSSGLYIKNMVTDYSSVPGGVDLGGNHYGVTGSSNFVSYPNNLKVSESSQLRGNSSIITTDNPATDMAKNERPASKNWDIGPLQFTYNTITPGILRITYA